MSNWHGSQTRNEFQNIIYMTDMKIFKKYNEFIDNAKILKFNELTNQAEEECCFLSSTDDIINNTKYQEVIKMGKDIIPLLLKKIEESGMWLEALSIITGEYPQISKCDYGKRDILKTYWKNWAKKVGYE